MHFDFYRIRIKHSSSKRYKVTCVIIIKSSNEHWILTESKSALVCQCVCVCMGVLASPFQTSTLKSSANWSNLTKRRQRMSTWELVKVRSILPLHMRKALKKLESTWAKSELHRVNGRDVEKCLFEFCCCFRCGNHRFECRWWGLVTFCFVASTPVSWIQIHFL